MSDDAKAIAELGTVSDSSSAHVITHYLYLPTREAAVSTAADLQRQGFQTEFRRSADGTNWLVLAVHRVVPTEAALLATRRSMEGIATKQRGEYDGWEANVRSDS